MPTGSTPRERVSTSRVVELVLNDYGESARYNQNLFSKLQDWYNIYRGIRQSGVRAYRNDLVIPFTLAMIQSLVARKVQALFASWPIVGFEGYDLDDAGRAKKNEVLISAQMKDDGAVLKSVDFFLSEAICGTAIARLGWKTLQGRNRVRRRVSVAPGLDIGVIDDEARATFFDGPTWEVIDRLDYFQQPAMKRIEDGWGIHRYWADLDELQEDAASDFPYFDPAGVRELSALPLSEPSITEYNMRRMTFRNEQDYQARRQARFSKPVEILERFGPVPSEFAPDGIRYRCIAIGNGRVILKNREMPMGNRMMPFLKYCSMPDPYSFDGVGKAEVAYGPQRTADRLNNQRLDAIDLLIDPPIFANVTSDLNKDHLFSRAGRVQLVNGNPREMISQMVYDMRGVQVGADEVGRLFGFMQLGTGETESLLGLSGPARETARGFLGRQENALTRVAMEATIAAEGFVEPLANAFRHMDRLWLTMPHEVKILGSMASVNPNTGLPYPAESHVIDYDDLAPDYRARAVGPTQMIGRGVRQQNLVALLQMMSANPALLQLVNWANFARQAFELFDFKNVNELLNPVVPQINQIADQTGQSPQAIQSAVSQPLDQMAVPGLMSAISGGQPQPQHPLMMAGMGNGAF